MIFELPLEDGKYKISYCDGKMLVKRYGEDWRDMTGDGLFHALLMSHIDLELELATLLKEKQNETREE